MRYDPNDAEVKAFIRTTRLSTYSEIINALVERFGPDRAWPLALIQAERAKIVQSGRRSRYASDEHVMAFLRERMDLSTLDEIVSQGLARLGRFPSRTATHRMVQKLRRETNADAGASVTRKSP